LEGVEIKVLDYFQYNAYVTLTMFFLSLLVLGIDKLLKGKATRYVFSTEKASLLNPLTYIRFFTHILGHRDWKHLSNNYLKILLLGPLIEEKYGWLNYLIMILITALMISIVNFIKGNSRIKGASGITFMLIILSAFVNVTEKKIPITLVLIILFYIIDEVKDLKKDDNIAHDAHLVGGICGAIFGFICINQPLINKIQELIPMVPDFFKSLANVARL